MVSKLSSNFLGCPVTIHNVAPVWNGKKGLAWRWIHDDWYIVKVGIKDLLLDASRGEMVLDCSIMPGSRVKAFDSSLFKNDIETPVSVTMKLGTVVCRYGYRHEEPNRGVYDDLVDVKFDHRPKQISHGHFTVCVEEIDG